jgi:hypothetical protein
MRHPFDGLNQPADNKPLAEPTRRAVLGQMAFAAAGLLGIQATARAQVTGALNEAGGAPPVATTLALGEEGGGVMTKALNEGGIGVGLTTEPFGEEAGRVTSQVIPGLEDGGAPAPAAPAPGTGVLNEEGAGTLLFNEGGGPVTKALNEGGGMARGYVPVQPQTIDRPAKLLEAAWEVMASTESAKGVQGCAIVYGSKQAVTFLKEQLKVKVPEVDEKRLAQLIADLDSDSFEAREKASAELAELGLAALPALQKAVKDTESMEVRMRAQRLLDKSKDSPVLVQAKRGLEVLVALRTPEAKELLETLAKGPEKDWLTAEAKEAVGRLAK